MFVQVGIAMFVLVAFNVFVLDYGVMWVARSQAQAAADAGALAGAVARGYDDFDPTPSPTGDRCSTREGGRVGKSGLEPAGNGRCAVVRLPCRGPAGPLRPRGRLPRRHATPARPCQRSSGRCLA